MYIRSNTFNIQQIADSGQCFRINPLPGGGYSVVTGEHIAKVIQHPDGAEITNSTLEEFEQVWIPYFDFSTDYEGMQAKMQHDPFLRQAISVGGGIRILRQDLWEMVVTYIISQRNNIPRIRKSVEALCMAYGVLLGEIDGQEFYSFPRPDQLRGKDLSVASLGYRERYIKEISEYNPRIWDNLLWMDDETIRKTLLSIKGVGEKVANCIMLYGMHRLNCYPRDVWINRMIDSVYNGDFDPEQYPVFAGYVQQLQFYCYRKMSKDRETGLW